MATLKDKINRILGNNVRLLLPSYWWKRVFGLVVDRIDEVEQSTSELIEASKMPIVESESNLSQLDLPKGSVAAVKEVGESKTINISDCYFSTNYEEDWEKYTIVKRVEEKANMTPNSSNSVWFSASKDLKDRIDVGKSYGGDPYYTRGGRVTTLSKVNEALSSGKYRAIDYMGESDQSFIFYSEIPQPSLFIKGGSWERLAKESDINITVDSELSKTSKNAVQNKVIAEEFDKQQCVFVVSSDGTTPENYKQQNKESYNKVYEAIDADRWMNVFVLYGGYFRIQVDSITISGSNEIVLYATFDDSFIEFRVSSDGSVVTQNSGSLTIDTSLSTTSINAVQNKVITEALNDKVDTISLSKVATSGSYNDLKDKPDGITRNTYLMPNNGFSGDSSFGISYLNNALYSADKRFVVESTGFSGGTDQLFDGNYEGGLTLAQGQTGTLTISNNGNNIIDGYPYGDIILSFYYNNVPESASVEVYCNHEPHGIGWKTLDLKSIEGSQKGIYKFTNGFYNITQVRVTVTAKADISTSLVEVDWHLNRGRLGNYPVITKYGLEQEMFGHYIFKDAVTIGGKKISSIEDLNNAVNTPIVQTTSTTLTLEPNKYYSYVVSPGPSSMTITLSTPNDTTIVNTYMLSFTAGSNGTSLSLPADIKWLNGDIPTIESYEKCQLSIVDKCAILSKFV